MPVADGTYATQTEFEEYVGNVVVQDQDELRRELHHAEKDIDSIIPGEPFGVRVNGLKIDPAADLDADDGEALMRATCAQLEYRLEMGPEFFVRPQYDSSSTGQFAKTGRAPMIGPKVWRELRGSAARSHVPRVVI